MPRLPVSFRLFHWPLGPSLAALLFIAPACETTETGRHRLNSSARHLFVSDSAEIEMGVEAYKQSLEKAKVSQDKSTNDLVRRVGKRIAAVTPHSADYNWEFTVVEDDQTVNAFCLPGG